MASSSARKRSRRVNFFLVAYSSSEKLVCTAVPSSLKSIRSVSDLPGCALISENKSAFP